MLVLLPTFASAGEPQPLEPGDLLGSTGILGQSLIDIDPTTGAGTFRAELGVFGPVTEVEFRSDGVLFATTGADQSNVITIDPLTGEETLVGQHPTGAINGLEFVGDNLYGSYLPLGPAAYSLVVVDQSDGSLTVVGPLDGIDPATGAGSIVGSTGFPAISGLAFVPSAPDSGPSVLEIPTLADPGLLILIFALAFAGWLAARGR
jgi:hypothetical protein